MAALGELFVKIGADTKGLQTGLDGAEKKMGGFSNAVQKHGKAIGIAMIAVGAAGLKVIDMARKMNAQLGVTALNLDVTTKEMRDLALSTTNVTFPLEEVIASFDLLARAGVKDTEVLQATATAFDTLGDAVGMGAGAVTEKMVPAMKTFGLSAEEVADKTDLMTNLVRNTTVSLDNFGSVIGYITPELVAMGLTLEDTVALMAIMEGKGMSGEVATRAFRTAITQATREQIPLQEALGITSVEMDTYRDTLEGIDGMTAKYAETANLQYGIMDKLKQKWSELTLQYGSMLQPLEPILAAMTALGPMLMIFSTVLLPKLTFTTIAHTIALIAHKVALIASAIAIKAVTVAQWLWNAALTANPIGVVIMAIAGLVAAGIALYKNWDKVTAFFKKAWADMKIAVLTAVEWILKSLEKFLGWIPKLGDKIREASAAFSDFIDAEKIKRDADKVEVAVNKLAYEAFPKWGNALEDVTGKQEGLTDSIEGGTNALTKQEEALKKNIAEMERYMAVMGATAAWKDYPGGKGAWVIDFAALAIREGIPWEAGEMTAEVERAIHGLMVPGATGGIITKPTPILAGEKGPEALIPLGGGGMGNVIINFTEPVFMDREDTMNKFVDKIGKALDRKYRLRFGTAYAGG